MGAAFYTIASPLFPKNQAQKFPYIKTNLLYTFICMNIKRSLQKILQVLFKNTKILKIRH